MSAHDAVDATVRALLAGVAARDLAAIEGLLAERVVWHGDGPGGGCQTREDALATLLPALDGPSAPRVSERGRTGDQVLLEVELGAGEERCLLVTVDPSGRIARILDCASAAVAERDMRRRAAAAAAAGGGVPDAPETPGPVRDLVPFVHVADIGRSIAFYELLGLRVCGTYEPGGRLVWAHLRSDRAAVMLALAEEPVSAREQGVLFYLYTPDLAALRDHLVAAGAGPGQIVDGSPGPREELRIDDPDGYRLMIAQLDGASG
jgi:predicted enzyme related to lactoylglutathione lyase